MVRPIFSVNHIQGRSFSPAHVLSNEVDMFVFRIFNMGNLWCHGETRGELDRQAGADDVLDVAIL